MIIYEKYMYIVGFSVSDYLKVKLFFNISIIIDSSNLQKKNSKV